MATTKKGITKSSNEPKKGRKFIIGGGIAFAILLMASVYFMGLVSGTRYGENSVDTTNDSLTASVVYHYNRTSFSYGASGKVERGLKYWLTTLLGTPVSRSYAYVLLDVSRGDDNTAINRYHCGYDTENTNDAECDVFSYEWHRVKGKKDTIVSRNKVYNPSFLEKVYCVVSDPNGVKIKTPTKTWAYIL